MTVTTRPVGASQARIGQAQCAWLAHEQRHAEDFLELLDLVTDGGRRDEQTLGGSPKTRALGRDAESAQATQG